MRKLLNKPWVVALLALAAVGFVVHTLMSQMGGYSSSGTAVDEAAPEPEYDAGASGPARRSAAEALRDLAITPATRDPFIPRSKPESVVPVAAEKTPEPDIVETVKLTALWIQSGTTYLLINDKVVKPGESIGRLTLEAATPDGVWLTHWKGRDFLSIGSTFTLTTPAKKAANNPAPSTSGGS
jgi:hypothetical protein